MRATSVNEASLVRAAQAGDRLALDDLAGVYLPLVYNVVGRALSGHPDVDDIVQDTMLRALRDLGTLRTPESFRTWLLTIAVRQVGTHLQRRRVAIWRTATLDEAADLPDTDADFEGMTILRLGLSGQRRQAARASRWLDADDRALLSLWWLETAGHLTRTELAAALGVSAAHAGVRVQRMSHQLELSRLLVAALEARPRCAGLAGAITDWDGQPSPLWRKRLARHVRSCPVCAQATEGLIPTAQLLVGLALVPVPLALVVVVSKSLLSGTAIGASLSSAVGSTASIASSGTAAKAGLFGHLAQVVSAHPVAAAVVAGAMAAGTIVAVSVPTSEPGTPPAAVAQGPGTTAPTRPTPAPTTRAPAPAPTTASPSAPGPGTVTLGPVSLELLGWPGLFVVLINDQGVLAPVNANSAEQFRQSASFEVVPGLAKTGCYSLRARDGRYLRHSTWRLRLSADEYSPLFRGDATFCARPGSAPGSVALESANYPGRYLRHVGGGALWIEPSDGSAYFRASSSFRMRPALAE